MEPYYVIFCTLLHIRHTVVHHFKKISKNTCKTEPKTELLKVRQVWEDDLQKLERLHFAEFLPPPRTKGYAGDQTA